MQGTSNDPRVANGIAVREEVCDAAGTCTCLRLALLGTFVSGANDNDTSAFRDWLNGNTDGTATVTLVETKPAIDEAFLAQYDILVVANVNTWAFTDAEKAAVAAWSAKGGGIITLTGFVSDATEAAQSSQLLQFAGLSYSGSGQPDFTAQNGQATPVYYDGGTENLKSCLSWSMSSDAIITTPINFAPQTGTLETLTFELDYVGAYIGWGVNVDPSVTDATILATDPTTGKNMAVAREVNGAGRVFAFGDEWVIFANQWLPAGTPSNQQMDEYNPCYIPETMDFHSVRTLYQTKQFWYNAINWVAPPNECNFVVQDTDVVVK